MDRRFTLKVLRGTPERQYWEEFSLLVTPGLNVTTALLRIQKQPVTIQGEKTTPVAWEEGCLEEVCGSCSVLLNGRPRQACTALIEKILQETGSSVITVAPLSKFPLVRDLVVNRDSMFETLKKVQAWVDVDDAKDVGFGPKVSPSVQEVRYQLSTCMTCGCCLEACPQVGPKAGFIGPAAISQVRLFNTDSIGKLQAPSRLRTLMEEGGLEGCGNAQNCVAVCPKKISLTESIALMQKEAGKQALQDCFGVPDA